MKLPTAFGVLVMGLAATVAAMPAAEADASVNEAFNILEARKGCSGSRKNTDRCGGNRLAKMNSFHNW